MYLKLEMMSKRLEQQENSPKYRVEQKGPLESILSCSSSKIIDFLAIHKEWDYSVTDIADNSNLSFKTTLGEIKRLEQQNVVIQTRRVGKATMYKLNLNSGIGSYLNKLIFEIAKKRVEDSMKPDFTERLDTVLNGLKQQSESLEKEKQKELKQQSESLEKEKQDDYST